MLENAKVTAIEEETAKFVRSGEYEKLPTEAEQNKAMEEMREDKEIKSEEMKPEEMRPEDVQVSEDEAGTIEGAGTSERTEASEGIETTTAHQETDHIESEEEKKLKRAKA